MSSVGTLIEGVSPPETVPPTVPPRPSMTVNFNTRGGSEAESVTGWWKCTKKILKYFTVVTIIVGVITLIWHFASGSNERGPVLCYSCYATDGAVNLTFNIPYESECMDNPKSRTMCGRGQACIISRIKHTGGTLFFRSCANVTDQVGCIDLKPPKIGHSCLCDTPLCKI